MTQTIERTLSEPDIIGRNVSRMLKTDKQVLYANQTRIEKNHLNFILSFGYTQKGFITYLGNPQHNDYETVKNSHLGKAHITQKINKDFTTEGLRIKHFAFEQDLPEDKKQAIVKSFIWFLNKMNKEI